MREPRAARRCGSWRAQRAQADLGAGLRRTGPARPEGRTQRLTVRMTSRLADGPARLEVVLPDRILEQNESAGDVGGAPDAITPRGRRHPGSGECFEHVFGKLRRPSDGPLWTVRNGRKMAWLCGVRCNGSCSSKRTAVRHTDEPSDDQTSILRLTRSTTSDAKSVVPWWPPRSGVRTPAAVASSTLS